MNSKLVVGRVVDLGDGVKRITPIAKQEETLDHQKKVATLIAAAYVYRDTHTVESIERLKRAAEEL